MNASKSSLYSTRKTKWKVNMIRVDKTKKIDDDEFNLKGN